MSDPRVNTSSVSTTAPGASDEATFAAALGLTQSVPAPKRARRKADTIGRPLVTAQTAAQAGAATGAPPTMTARVTGATPVITNATTGYGALPAVGVASHNDKVTWWKRRRMRVRRVRRTLRHIDPWSVFKISVLLFTCLYIAVMAAGVLLWRAAVEAGLIERVESFFLDYGVLETFVIEGDTVFRSAAIIGVVMVAAASALAVVAAILFNLISDLTGGLRVTVLEEDLGRPERVRR